MPGGFCGNRQISVGEEHAIRRAGSAKAAQLLAGHMPGQRAVWRWLLRSSECQHKPGKLTCTGGYAYPEHVQNLRGGDDCRERRVDGNCVRNCCSRTASTRFVSFSEDDFLVFGVKSKQQLASLYATRGPQPLAPPPTKTYVRRAPRSMPRVKSRPCLAQSALPAQADRVE
mmetsp:Transcript_46447/g.100908  ORF Transcript_46447/g.100908 Transcript_46447/m.100908 type:complete len:171 (-) Transcript_46447:808-1320(-)